MRNGRYTQKELGKKSVLQYMIELKDDLVFFLKIIFVYLLAHICVILVGTQMLLVEYGIIKPELREDTEIIAFSTYLVIVVIHGIYRLTKVDWKAKFYKDTGNKKEWDGNNSKILKKENKNNDFGLVLGKVDNEIIYKPEEEDGHVLVIGGSGSGKSTGVAIPSLMSWKQRVFCIDIKGELIKKSGRTGMSKIFGVGNYGYDPFYLLKETNNEAQVALDIAIALIPMPVDTKDPYWIDNARLLLQASIMHFHRVFSFSESIGMILDLGADKLIKELREHGTKEVRRITAQFALMLESKSSTMGGIFSQLSKTVMIYGTDSDLQNLLGSEVEAISPKDILKWDVFINIPEHRLENWENLLTLIVTQQIQFFEMQNEENIRWNTLILLDEFARLGKIQKITHALATLRSKKVRITLLTQSLAQLDLIYGKDTRKVIVDNCSHKLILRATDHDTQEYFSKLVGTYEALKYSRNVSKQKPGLLDIASNQPQYPTVSENVSTEEKRIYKPEWFGYLKDELILFTPTGCYQIDKVKYYEDSRFLKTKEI